MAKLLEKRGWELQRVRGSHHVYKKPGIEETAVVPIHRNLSLKIGMQRSLMKLAGIDQSEL